MKNLSKGDPSPEIFFEKNWIGHYWCPGKIQKLVIHPQPPPAGDSEGISIRVSLKPCLRMH
jgi:hypothetical protein